MTNLPTSTRSRRRSHAPADGAAPLRVTIVTPIMAPYRVPVFNVLAARDDIDLHVVYLAESDPNRSWLSYQDEMAFSHEVLRELYRLHWNGAWLHLSSGMVRALRRKRPHVIVLGGWDQPVHHLVRWLAPVLRSRVVAWVESNARDARGGGRLLDVVKRTFLSGCAAVVVPGRASADYAATLGVEPARVHVAPNAVDNARFAATPRSDDDRRPTILYVGRLEESKGVDTLLEAWRRLSPGTATLRVAGEGTLAPAVAAAAGDGVELLGHVQRDDLAAVYRDADVFVFPSKTDPWGLVLNEAMAAALPVVTTPAPGAVDDLVVDGWNGILVPADDAAALAAALERLAGDGDLRATMGSRSLERIAAFSPEACAAGLAAAVWAAAETPAAGPSG